MSRHQGEPITKMDPGWKIIVKEETYISETEHQFEFVPTNEPEFRVKSEPVEPEFVAASEMECESREDVIREIDPLSDLDQDHLLKAIKRESQPESIVSICEVGINEEIAVDVKCEALEQLREEMMEDNAAAESSESTPDQAHGPDLSCKLCSQVFNSNIHLRRHKSHCGKLQPTVPVESESYADKKSIKKSSECVASSQVTQKEGVLAGHKTTMQTGDNCFHCDVCGKVFATKQALRKHVKMHTSDRPYNCDGCDAKFVQRCQLTKHLKTHSTDRPFVCDECGAKFKWLGSLNEHTRTHTGDKPYSCDKCGAKFTWLSALNSHMICHTGERPYKCDKCGLKFLRHDHLNSHKKIHLGIKPYECTVCGHKFSQSNTLTAHMKVHTGVRPFGCHRCNASFSGRATLTRHLRIHMLR